MGRPVKTTWREIKMHINGIKHLLELALAEDIGNGDVTSDAIIPADLKATGIILAKDTGVIAGLEVVKRVFEMVDEELNMTSPLKDGDLLEPGVEIAKVFGPAGAMLTAERTALNFLQRLSGIATMAAKFVQAVAGYPVKIVDTRKTTPGWRMLEKYAVRAGGAHNHRFGLDNAVLIKDNHIALAGSIKKAVEMAKAKIPFTMKIEVETETLEQVEEVLHSQADIIMLDNMNADEMRGAVKLINGSKLVEASGGVRLENVAEVAATGVDIISVGALTHSAMPLDISMEIFA